MFVCTNIVYISEVVQLCFMNCMSLGKQRGISIFSLLTFKYMSTFTDEPTKHTTHTILWLPFAMSACRKYLLSLYKRRCFQLWLLSKVFQFAIGNIYIKGFASFLLHCICVRWKISAKIKGMLCASVFQFPSLECIPMLCTKCILEEATLILTKTIC